MDGIIKAGQGIIPGQTEPDPTQNKQLNENPPDPSRGIADHKDTLEPTGGGTLLEQIAEPGGDPNLPIVEQIAALPQADSGELLVEQIAAQEPNSDEPLLDQIASKGDPSQPPLIDQIAQQEKYAQLLQMLGEQGKLDTQQIQNLTANFKESQSVREKFQQALNNLQDQGKLNQFEIQTLMSQFNDDNATSDIFNSSISGNTKLDASDNQTLGNLFNRKSELKSSYDNQISDLQSNGNLMETQIAHLVDARAYIFQELANILAKKGKTDQDIAGNIK